ncbi:cotranscriptional regulator FAM172A homolog [Stegodyphus dumicola]|uniref:cotranscriptional regulator FAM172A homolog n=1 Tax=Stegodyphus dumicola TaxID=202533 RepID=UPI0015B18F53|nr:cotranscriptional regulator FAM172A homolog [Stegodyphus dumicola]
MVDDIKSTSTEVNSNQDEEGNSIMSKIIYYDEFPKTFEEFGYKFNEFGQLQHITTGESFVFDVRKDDHVYNQKRYEAIGELVTDYVYNLLIEEGNLHKMTLPIDANEDREPTTFIFHSDDAFTNDKLVILIHGSGVVRAGQWSRRLIINDSLNSGTQLPFIKRAKGLGYGVIVLNTNDNGREYSRNIIKIRGNESPENHGNYVWRNLILTKAAAKHIAIVAHSYGGIVAVNMCKTFPESFRERVIAIAFTDSPHSLVAQGLPPSLIEWLRTVSRNWVSSHKPLDTPLILSNVHEVECYSAGTQRHDLTSWMSFTSVYEFIDAKYRRALLSANDRDL